ncbi:MAG: hypothetical protein OXN92_11685 [Gammaproteobacteria bacterium]|nr:hypothetical protein [Gammaproteobacteria bacterium]MXW09262.1 hypothetical protein [Gammaproteobacteria bacterium]MYC53178.1 hypothetical protein [Gammaproteobacteria bacterium]
MDEMWQLYMAMGTVLAAVVTAMAFGWRVSSAMRKENREAHAGIRTEIQTVRKELGAEIAENREGIAGNRERIAGNREAIAGLREDLAAFKGHIDAKIDAHGARIDLLEARVAKTGEDVAFIKGLLTGGGQD